MTLSQEQSQPLIPNEETIEITQIRQGGRVVAGCSGQPGEGNAWLKRRLRQAPHLVGAEVEQTFIYREVRS